MTEADWLAATDPQPMLEFLRGKASDRKLRLFAVACCRSVWDSLKDPRSRRAVEMSEAFADGDVSQDDFAYAEWKAEGAYFECLAKLQEYHREQRLIRLGGLSPDDAVYDSQTELVKAADCAQMAHLTGDSHESFLSSTPTEFLRPEWLLDLFGNPFRPVAFDPAWLTETVVSLAAGIYADRAFDRMPILADALQDAGCENHDVLTHCRSDGPHARGCWVLDGVLGKS